MAGPGGGFCQLFRAGLAQAPDSCIGNMNVTFDDAPPPLDEDDRRHPCHDPLYKDIDPTRLPHSESLSQCLNRTLPYWHEVIVPNILSGRQLLIVSHGNTLRGLRMYIENLDKIEIQKVEIPLGIPFVYFLDENLKPIKFELLE